MEKERKVRAPRIDKTAISPYENYCDGYGAPGAQGNGYVSVLKVSVGTVEKTDDFLLDGIVSYDRAEINDAYVGQINMFRRKENEKTDYIGNFRIFYNYLTVSIFYIFLYS